MAVRWAIFATLLAVASCAPREETTPRGFVIAPSVPADAGVPAVNGG